MRRNWREEWRTLGVTPSTKSVSFYSPPLVGPSYVMAEATHTRLSPIKSSFTGVVPMVRVDLPLTTENVLADTALGEVLAGDIKLYSLELFNAYYANHLGFEAKRVVVTTPPRINGGRFAAILYGLVYENAHDTLPRCYYMAGGMANGPTRVLYSSVDMSSIRSRTGYKPTPFSSVDNLYHGGLELDASGHASRLWIDVNQENMEPHLQLRVKLTRVSNVRSVDPYTLLLQAACRVAAIAHEMGQEVPDLGPLTTTYIQFVV